MIIQILLVVGIMLNLLKGVELLLSKEQSKDIQTFLEDLTLRIDEIKKDDLLSKFSDEVIQAVLVMITYLEFGLVIILTLIVQSSSWKEGGVLYNAFGIAGKQIQIIAIFISLATLLFAWKWPLPNLMKWIIKDGKSKRKVYTRLFLILVIGFGFFGVYQFGLYYYVAKHMKGGIFENSTFVMWGLLPIWPLFTIFWVLSQSIGLLLPWNKKAGKFIFYKFVISLKWILWRIVQYEKGAVSALVLLITIVLGVITVIFQ